MKYLILAVLIGCAYGTAIIKKPKIVGGLTAQDGQFPYQAAVIHVSSNRFFCSGSIISNEWVLTSAVCSDVTHAKNMMVRVGSVHLGDNGFGYGVDRTVKHPLYWDRRRYEYNIAVIKIAGSIRFGDNVGSIALSSIVELPPNLDLLSTGWGIPQIPPSGETGKPAHTLQYITLKSINTEKCLEYFWYMNISKGQVRCTDVQIKGEGSCTGDWGNPLVYENEQVGIDSSGDTCHGPSLQPTVFTNVGHFRLWIKKITGV